MVATKLRGHITTDRQLIVELPVELAPGTVEIILLQDPPTPSGKRAVRHKANHPAFGIWAQRNDIGDSAVFAAQLRQRVERRADRNGSE